GNATTVMAWSISACVHPAARRMRSTSSSSLGGRTSPRRRCSIRSRAAHDRKNASSADARAATSPHSPRSLTQPAQPHAPPQLRNRLPNLPLALGQRNLVRATLLRRHRWNARLHTRQDLRPHIRTNAVLEPGTACSSRQNASRPLTVSGNLIAPTPQPAPAEPAPKHGALLAASPATWSWSSETYKHVVARCSAHAEIARTMPQRAGSTRCAEPALPDRPDSLPNFQKFESKAAA